MVGVLQDQQEEHAAHPVHRAVEDGLPALAGLGRELLLLRDSRPVGRRHEAEVGTESKEEGKREKNENFISHFY